jgi:hypothetical protein
MEDHMRKLSFGLALISVIGLSSCAMTKGGGKSNDQTLARSNQKEGTLQTEQYNQANLQRATELTQGWPTDSTQVASEMIKRYGPPNEQTADSLVWNRNIAPFKKIIVHKTAYTSNNPFKHMNVLEHVVEYNIKTERVEEALDFNKSLVFDKSKGQMSSYAESEPMNILSLNLANKVMNGEMKAESARTKLGKEALNYINGERSEITSVLLFRDSFQSADQDKSITSEIQWKNDPDLKQAQEEKKSKE